MTKHIGNLYYFSHAQNLAEKRGERGKNGRAWLHLYWGDPNKRGRKLTCLGVQWVLLRKQHSIGVSLDIGGGDGDRDVDFSIRVPWFGLYVGAEDIWPRRWRFYNPGQKYPSSREWSIKWMDQGLWIYLGRDPDESWSKAPFWDARSRKREIIIKPLDILFGRTRCTTEKLAAAPAVVTLPEGEYPVQVIIERRTWSRKRAPWWKHVRVNATVESEKGLPIPGKGENGWDMDDDAYFSIGTPETTVEAAAAYAAEQVLKTRQRYASRNWVPA